MPSRLSTIFLALVLLIAAPVSAEEPWKPAKLWVTGTDKTIWVAGKSAGTTSLPVVQIWHATGDAQIPKQSLYLPPISGDPLQVAADAQALRVLYGNLTACDYYGDRPYGPGALWRGECRGRPVAWCGDSSLPISWALVDTKQLEVPAASGNDGDDVVVRVMPSTRLTLLKLQSGVWTRHPGPEIPSGSSASWLASRAGTPRVFWTGDGKLLTSVREDDAWSTTKAIPIDAADLRYGWTGVMSDGAVFVAGKRLASDRYELRLMQEKDGTWTDAGTIRESNEALVIDPEIAGLALARGQLAVVRPAAEGTVEFGMAPLGVSPAVRFNTLSISRSDFQPPSQWEDSITLALCLIVMTTALWTRRDLAVRVLPLPKGLMPAMVWKRVLAGLIDIIPAILITLPWWYPKFVSLGLEGRVFPTTEEQVILQNQTQMEHYSTLAVYGLWCFLWELFLARTPGKILLGCRVISVDGSAPTPRQCLIRNVIRTLMVSLGATGFLVTIMSIVIVTRNRQRTGDLLAQTLVVEPGEVPPVETSPVDDSRMGPFD
ncbi:MAG: RDD family protein [Planctomycetota bacterium]